METQPHNIEAIWDTLAKEFRNWNGMRPRRSWFRTGLSERAGHNRIRVLEGGPQAKTYFSLTKELNGDELNYLQTRATINLEQAQAAARLATIFNLTIFIGAIVIFNQVFPGYIADKAREVLQSSDFAIILLSAFTIVLFCMTVICVLAYSHGGTAQARDLKHLLELSLARRALRQKHEYASKDDTSIETDLRDNFLSDI